MLAFEKVAFAFPPESPYPSHQDGSIQGSRAEPDLVIRASHLLSSLMGAICTFPDETGMAMEDW